MPVFLLSFYSIAIATSMSLMEISSTLVALYAVFLLATKKVRCPKISEVPFFRPMLIFAGVALLGIFFSETTLKEKIYDIGRMRFFLLYFLAYIVIGTQPMKVWLRPLLATCVVVSIYAFIQHFMAIDILRPEGKKVLMYALQDEKIGPLVVGAFNHHLTFANVFLFFACLFFALGLGRRQHLLTIFGLFLFLLVAWTHSRTAWIAIPICVTLTLLYTYGKKVAAIGLVGGLIALGGVYLSSESLQIRFQRSFETSQEVSYAPRVRLWRAQWEMIKRYPVFGIGWNTNERRAKEFVDALYPNEPKNFYGHAHSTLLQIWATTGTVGLIVFLWLWVEIFKVLLSTCRRLQGEERSISVGILAGFVGFGIQGLTQWNFGDAEVAHNVVFFWAVAATLFQRKSASPSLRNA